MGRRAGPISTPKSRTSKGRGSVGRTTMPKRTTDFREDLLADLANPQEAAHYLNAASEDSEQMVLVALRDIAEARQMARVADEAGVARESKWSWLLFAILRKRDRWPVWPTRPG